MKGEVKSLKLKATLLKNKMAKNQEQWVKTFQAMQHVEDTDTIPAHIGRLRIHMYNNDTKVRELLKFKYFCVGVHVRFQCVIMKAFHFSITSNHQAELISKRTVMSVACNNDRCINHSYIWVVCVH